MRTLSYQDAIREAIFQEMERDPRVFVMGVGAPTHPYIFGTTKGLLENFGSNRCFDTPISEDAMTGFALGAAIKGLRPIHVHIRADFLLLAMNQLINNLSTFSYSTDGKHGAPIVIRAIIGRGWGQGYQHSKSLFSYFTHIPGLKVIAPTTPYDVKGLLTEAIKDDNPVICFEHRWLYWAEDVVPEEPYTVPIGKARVLREGKDITVVATSWMNIEALRAADFLKERGVMLEVIDPRTLYPLDLDTIITSVSKTGRLIVADCDWVDSGFSAEVAASISYSCHQKLHHPIERLGFKHTPCPTVRHLEDEFYCNSIDIVECVDKILGHGPTEIDRDKIYSHESRFKGPF
jgi:pyruvate/2-oxoglutarate/acetoin dehydrogenase E1 component